MASSATPFCTLCQEDDVSSPAVIWCLECEDWLCTDCEKHHGRSKTSKQHKTITNLEHGSLPPHVLKISSKCNEHKYKFDRFCSFHGTPCCIQCVQETHKECELRPLTDVLENVKCSSAVTHLERDLTEIQKKFKVVEKHLFERIAKVADQTKHCVNEIKRVRTSVNEHLDTIERNILDELSQKEKDIKKTIESLVCQIESKKRRIIEIQDSLLKTKQYATDLQVLLSIKEMEKQTSEDMKYLEDLGKRDEMADKILECIISPALQSLQSDVVDFGKISVKSVPSTLKLTGTRQGQVHLSGPVVSTLDKVNLVRASIIKVTGRKNPIIKAGVILPTEQSVIADYQNDVLVLYDSNGKYVRDVVQTSGYPIDMCYIKDNIVGISFYDKQKVDLIDVSKNKILKTIPMKNKFYGIDCNDGMLYVRVPYEEIVVVMDMNGRIKHRLYIPGKSVTSIAVNKNYIYCTDWVTSDVLCYDMNGEMVWKHKYEALKDPRSITIDKRSDIIYVVGYQSNNLLAISLDGEQSKVVLSEEDGLNKPRSVHVSTDSKLLVCNNLDCFAFVYQL